MLFAKLLLILNWKVNVFYLLETTASNICQLNSKLAVMKAKWLTAGLTNSLKQLLRFFQFHHCEFLRWTIKNNSRVCLETHAVLSEAGWPYKFKGAITPFAIFFRITWILKITSFCHIRLNIKTLKLFPVVYCNEWQRSCHGHGMKLGQRFQVFFLPTKIPKKLLVLPDKISVWYLRHLTLQE